MFISFSINVSNVLKVQCEVRGRCFRSVRKSKVTKSKVNYRHNAGWRIKREKGLFISTTRTS